MFLNVATLQVLLAAGLALAARFPAQHANAVDANRKPCLDDDHCWGFCCQNGDADDCLHVIYPPGVECPGGYPDKKCHGSSIQPHRPSSSVSGTITEHKYAAVNNKDCLGYCCHDRDCLNALFPEGMSCPDNYPTKHCLID